MHILFPHLQLANATCNDVKDCVTTLTKLINTGVVPLLVTIALFIFIYGTLKYLLAGGNEDELRASKSYIVYGIISLAVIVAIWGLVKFVVIQFFPDGYALPQFSSQNLEQGVIHTRSMG